MLQVNLGNNRFSLTDNFMDTIIEDLSEPDKPKVIILNNLAICSLADRGEEFCFNFAVKNGGVSHFQAPILKLKAHFYSDGNIVLFPITGGAGVRTHLKFIVEYYNKVLCNIILKENMKDGTKFIDEKDKTLKTLKEDFKDQSKPDKKTLTIN